jgi:hypothetical protein
MRNPTIGGYTAILSALARGGLLYFAKVDEHMILAWDGKSILREISSGTRKKELQVIENADGSRCFAALSLAVTNALNDGWTYTSISPSTKVKGQSVMDYIDGEPTDDGIGFLLSWERAGGNLTFPDELIRTDIGSAVSLRGSLQPNGVTIPEPNAMSGTVREGSNNFFALWRLKKLYPAAVTMTHLKNNEMVDLRPAEWRDTHTDVMEEFGLIMPRMKIDTSHAKTGPISFF